MERCTTCATIDLDSLFQSTEIPAEGFHITTIGKPRRPLKRLTTAINSRCELCEFFHSLAPAYFRRYELHVRLFNHLSEPSWRDSSTDKASKSPFLTVLRKNSRLRYDCDIAEEVVQNGLCVFLKGQESEDDADVVRICPTVDFNFIGTQLRHCIDTHQLCKRDAMTKADLIHISLLDCVAHVIVERPLTEQYLTLSYVWGRKSRGPVGTVSRNNLFEDPPLTVRDAMAVVRKLGYRYIWVDRFCIDQDDTPARATMIANMDLIYEFSTATIVALRGDNDEAGLPGVSTSPRVPQISIKCGSGSLLSSCPPLRTAIEHSRWSTRGWTYQEARLSRRCLFFSSTQVYLACQEYTISEAVPYPPHRNSISQLLNSERLGGKLFGRNAISHAISLDRLMYTKRDLTFPGDALNAFRGMLRRSQYITFWGVPVTMRESRANPNDTFALGLLWIRKANWMGSAHLVEPQVHLARRESFPTWSWASLETEIYQDGYGEQSLYGQYLEGRAVDLPCNEAQIMFSIAINGTFQPLVEILHQPHDMYLPEESPQLLVRGYILSLACTRRDERTLYKLDGSWRYFGPDLRSEDVKSIVRPNLDDIEDLEESEDVLILVQWKDAQRSGQTRFVLMVLEWLDECRAQRKGLLSEYRHTFSTQWVDSLPRVFKEFLLE